MPSGKLVLKVRVLIILLWNLLPDNSLYNGTRLVVIALGRYIITGKILGGLFNSYIRSVPKIASIIDKKYLGFAFKRF
jgi:hypothetical protein